MSDYVARKSEKYEVFLTYHLKSYEIRSYQMINLLIAQCFVFVCHRTIASVSVITVLATSIFIWMNILEDDSNLSETFQGLRLGTKYFIPQKKPKAKLYQ